MPENTVSIVFYACSSIVKSVSDCRLPGVILKLINTVSIGKVKILKNILYLCRLRLFYIVYSANPDEMSLFATIHLGHEPVLPVSRIKG